MIAIEFLLVLHLMGSVTRVSEKELKNVFATAKMRDKNKMWKFAC